MSTKTDILQIKYEVTGDGQVLRSFSAVHEKLTEEDRALQKNRASLRELQDEVDKAGKRKREFADQLSKLNAAYESGAISSAKLRKETLAATADYVRGTAAFKAGMAGAALAVTALSAATAIYIRNTIESEKVQAQLAARIADTNAAAGQSLDSLNAMADQIDRLTNFDDEAIGGVQATLLTFKEIKGEEFRGAVDAVLDLSTAMGMDLQSAAVMVGKALQDPIQGVTALRRAGVQLNDSQEATIKKLVETGNVAAAQGIILGELESQMGTAAESARNTLGGALQQLQDDFNNLLEGDAGDNGMVATRENVEGLISFLQEPDTRAAVDDIAGGIAGLAAACATLVVDAHKAWKELQSLLDLQGDLSNGGRSGGADTSLKRRQLGEIEAEQQARTLGVSRNRDPNPIGKLLGRPSAMSDAELARRRAALRSSIAQDTEFGLDDADARASRLVAGMKWYSGEATAKAPAGRPSGGKPKPRGSGGGGGSSELQRAARDAERARQRVEDALAGMSEAQDDWAQGLKTDTDPIAKEYADRLERISDMAEKARKAGVPADEVDKFTHAMEALAAQYRDADLAEFQREFREETEGMAAAMAGPAVQAAHEFAMSVAKLDEQLGKGLITQDQYAARVETLARKQTQAAREVLAGIEDEMAMLSMSAEQQEAYNALKYAGVDATSAEGQAIEAQIKQLQRLREVRGLAEGIGSAFISMSEQIGESTQDSKEIIDDFLRDVLRMILRFLAQKAVEKFVTWMVGAFTGGKTTGGSGGNPTVGPLEAAGGVWDNGVRQYASGGVVSAPTYFRHAGGMGLMGEAGAEAIMPLDRGADGKLGVRMVGGAGGGISIQTNTHVSVDNSGGKGDGNRSRAEEFSQMLQGEMDAAAMRVLVREQRQGGVLWRMQHG